MGIIRKANVQDVKKIQKLVNLYAKKDKMLPRSLNEIYENIRDFFVFAEGKNVLGCCALHVDWEDLAEVKSLAVAPSRVKKGVGSLLLESCLGEAKELGIKKVFALTYVPGFFRKAGFREIDKKDLPHKIWTECVRCVYFPNCMEIAVSKTI